MIDAAPKGIQVVFPAGAGMNRGDAISGGAASVFPAGAGMNRRFVAALAKRKRCSPQARG